ncbi:DNA polymerase III subunit gamma and tau [Aestuariimicrobium soli]|uniref:DNA polymerase III subunit gamma and tau n=1 Tax=Aestuariimicrobium soli TaxID=2035834 RepID=UPI003EBDCE98
MTDDYDDALDFDDDVEGSDDADLAFEQDGPGLFDFDDADEPAAASTEPEVVDEPDDAPADEPADDPVVELAPPAAAERAPRPTVPDAPLALYRRYRPDTFADVIGQEHVTEPLQRALANNKVNHAYLFSGPRGCGKTTSARILARALNCEQGPTPTPCGECQSCRELARGGSGSIDVIEIDAASHGGVEDARDLRERAFFAPVNSRYKIYIVDEAHMVTSAGFNALLKLVEEPPPHVKFIFATTEPEKVIGTIRSRTHHYPFRLVPPKVLSSYLGRLCEAEGVPVDESVLPLVVRAGAGSVRDSLSVLDQLLGGAGDQGVSYEQAASLLGFTPDTLLDEIMDAFAAGDAKGVFATVDKVIEVGQDPRRFAEDLLRRLRDLVIVAAVPDAVSSGLIDVAGDQAERLTVQARGLGAGELTRAAEVIAQGLTDMRGTTAPRLHLELMCSRVLLPGADVDGRGIHARLDRLERRLADTGVPVDRSAGSPTPEPSPREWDDAAAVAERPAARPVQRPAAPEAPEGSQGASLQEPAREFKAQEPTKPEPTNPQPVTQSQASQPASQPDASEPQTQAERPRSLQRPPAQRRPEQPQEAAPQRPTAAASAPGTVDVTRVRAEWPRVLEEVRSRRRFSWILLSQNAQVLDVTDGVLTLGFANPGARDNYSQGGTPDVLADSLVEVLGANLHVNAVVDGTERSHAARGGQPTGRPTQGPAAAGSSHGGASGRQAGGSVTPDTQGQAGAASAPVAGAAGRHLQAVPDPSHPSSQEPPPEGDDDPDPADDATRAELAPPADGGAEARADHSDHVRRAKQAIRPTVTASPPSPDIPAAPDEDEGDVLAEDDDPVIDSGASAHELIAKHLGGTIIHEE